MDNANDDIGVVTLLSQIPQYSQIIHDLSIKFLLFLLNKSLYT